MKLHQRIKRAEEELVRVDIEARRLYTSITDEEVDFEDMKKRLVEEGNYVLSKALDDFCVECRKDNVLNICYLQKLAELEKFRGDRNLLGVKLGAKGKGLQRPASVAMDAASMTRTDSDDVIAEGEQDDDEREQIRGVVDFIAEVSAS
jgi:hypothetical protein